MGKSREKLRNCRILQEKTTDYRAACIITHKYSIITKRRVILMYSALGANSILEFNFNQGNFRKYKKHKNQGQGIQAHFHQ